MIRRAADLTEFYAWMLKNEGKVFEEVVNSLGYAAELNSAMCRGDINMGLHPTKMDSTGKPASYFFLTAKGYRRVHRRAYDDLYRSQ